MSELAARPQRRLGDKISVIILSKLATTSIDIVTAIVLVRLLVKDELAVLTLVLVIYELARRVALFGYPESVLVFGADLAPSQLRSLANLTMKAVAKIAVGCGLVMIAMSFTVSLWLPNWAPENQELLSTVLPLFALAGVIEFPTWPTTQILIAHDRERRAGLYETGTSFLLLACILVPILLGGDAFELVIAVLAYAVLRAAVSYPLVFMSLPSESAELPDDLPRRQWQYAVPLGLEAFVGRANRYVDRFIIGYFLAEAAVADYHVAAQDIPLVKAVPLGFVGIMVPVYTRLRMRGDLDQVQALWQRAMTVVSSFTIPVAVFLCASAPDFLHLLFGPEYTTAATAFRIFSVAIFFRWAHFGTLLQAWENSGGILRISAIMLAVNALLNLPLTYFFGVAGAATATVLSSLVGRALYLRISTGQLQTQGKAAAPYAHGAKTTFIALIALVPWHLAMQALASSGEPTSVLVRMLVGAATFTITYLALGVGFRVFNSDHYRGLLYFLRMTERADRFDRL